MIYFRILFLVLWISICSISGLALSLVFWGNTNLNHWFGRLFYWGAAWVCRCRVEVEGVENLEIRQPCIYVANHQSAFEVVTFGRIYPRNTVVVGKKELLYIPLFGLFFKAAGNIPVDRKRRVSAISDLKAVSEQVRKRQVSVWIFPEGTRNRSDQPLMPFKKGAFYMALS